MDMGISLRMVSRLLLTKSGVPVRQTVVICWLLPFFGDETRTCASIGSGPLDKSAQSARRFARFWAWTGSSWTWTSSGASSGCVHLSTASVVAWRMSSVLGPTRSEANGMLNE